MRLRTIATLLLLLPVPLALAADPPQARDLVKAALDHWRGDSSYSEMTMIIHRADWQRSLSMRSWTRGSKHSLVRITAPTKDAGTATLLIDGDMWTFAPKVNRIIKVPSSMMGQSWMGSDFSNNDVAKADDILAQYSHSLIGQAEQDGMKIYTIEARPHEHAAVVWGKEVLTVRADHLLLAHDFYDQSDLLIKSLRTTEIKSLGGRLLPSIQRITNAEAPEEWTEIRLEQVRFNEAMPDWLFTQSNLRNPRH
ncbi:outer membrane lipoprotein-sorting protein [Simiduia agarivorans]|uniref:Uncharacterized protein TP-0789 domain-containing protein n=1 Tax=Simiduia agarivorans (strain DSM 21679 / JCM 13881 / BCRC 17597 / SA1) TaxID=1117647 RepID=K4KQE9_SIMAS|nr:outer membrane lipoprotein-sorting protein [Simiduia agarivorans]AFV00344.2 hypothetical protein M5M_16055 [Simiduia agarivorans SA1 = DSM 21679]